MFSANSSDACPMIVAGMVGEREQIFTISRRMVILRNEKSGTYGPRSHQRTTAGKR